jgi:hypothetical protein
MSLQEQPKQASLLQTTMLQARRALVGGGGRARPIELVGVVEADGERRGGPMCKLGAIQGPIAPLHT